MGMKKPFADVEDVVVCVPPDYELSGLVMVCYKMRDGRLVAADNLHTFDLPENWRVQSKLEFEQERDKQCRARFGMTIDDVMLMIGDGKALCIAFDGESAACIPPKWVGGERVEVNPSLAEAVVSIHGNVLARASKEDIRQKMGWESCGLPGDTHEVWRFIQ